MELLYTFRVRVSAPTKTTTGVLLEVQGLNVNAFRTAGSVQRALEEALVEFTGKLRPALLKEARWARSKTFFSPPETAADVEKPVALVGPEPPEEEPPAGPLPDHGPLFSDEDPHLIPYLDSVEREAAAAATSPRITGLTVPGAPLEP